MLQVQRLLGYRPLLLGSVRVAEVTKGNVVTVSLEDAALPQKKVKFPVGEHKCALCSIPVRLKYTDVLIMEQFMREDGTVLPRELTGLCKKQQLILERCVIQAHWSGLFPDRTIPELDRSGYKRFNRYWDHDLDIYRLKVKVEPGAWYFIKRYITKKDEFRKPLQSASK